LADTDLELGGHHARRLVHHVVKVPRHQLGGEVPGGCAGLHHQHGLSGDLGHDRASEGRCEADELLGVLRYTGASASSTHAYETSPVPGGRHIFVDQSSVDVIIDVEPLQLCPRHWSYEPAVDRIVCGRELDEHDQPQ
jgi:hypothetical protein